MSRLRFKKELYPKSALLKAAYHFTDRAYLHLDADEAYYYVDLREKDPRQEICEDDFMNEMLAQCVRYEVFQQTKNIRELLLARAMATTVITSKDQISDDGHPGGSGSFSESEILKDWFAGHV